MHSACACRPIAVEAGARGDHARGQIGEILTDRLVRLDPGVHDRRTASPGAALVDLAKELIEVRCGAGIEDAGRRFGLGGGRIGRERRCRHRQPGRGEQEQGEQDHSSEIEPGGSSREILRVG